MWRLVGYCVLGVFIEIQGERVEDVGMFFKYILTVLVLNTI